MKKLLSSSAFLAFVAVAFSGCAGDGGKPSGAMQQRLVSEEKTIDGQVLFVQNCAACHQKDRDAVGPMLQGATARWGGDRKRMYGFVKNNLDMIEKGDPRALELEKKWGGNMPLFMQLTDAEIEAILTYAD